MSEWSPEYLGALQDRLHKEDPPPDPHLILAPRGPFADFLAAIAARLERGAQTYGDTSFDRPLPELIEELRQECLDLAGWAFPVFVRLARLEEVARRIEERTKTTQIEETEETTDP